ncbi:MAG: metallophosphoesterase family protein [Candidatus Palauibacterales bacterium]|nr:metallophosphoesterase family protein [Candidatus Palauibacterales bacterium]MDP2528418.1 metallophosphoesterase family protein [Candidatus Palauibacterales bacterium]MDP2585004.1 metallophosphoesterase family protein [Candidatus Palauibacterales bacterium]
MRIAALYDIHGNLPALEAVLAAIDDEAVDEVVVGGDVLPGPMPTGCLACLRSLGRRVRFLRGNGEREVLAVRDGREPTGLPAGVVEGLRWVADQLSPGEADLLRSWPATVRLDDKRVGRVLFCHATPESDSQIFTRRTPEASLRALFEGADADVVACGHTHMSFDRAVGSVRVVNAGSVGMPFGEPGASWLRLGPGVELRRTPYDLRDAAERIRATDFPGAADFADSAVLHPRPEEAMLEAFERAADPGS